jgi:hypothetical protein
LQARSPPGIIQAIVTVCRVASLEISTSNKLIITHSHISTVTQVRALRIETGISTFEKAERGKIKVWVLKHIFPAVMLAEMLQ